MQKKEGKRNPKRFLSGIDTYIESKGRDFDPVIVASDTEWDSILRNLATSTSLRVRTTILPPGVNMEDPRLEHARIRYARLYQKGLGEFFEYPSSSFVGQVEGSLAPPAPCCISGKETRYQVIPDDHVLQSISRAQHVHKISRVTLTPLEVPHSRVSPAEFSSFKQSSSNDFTDLGPKVSKNDDITKQTSFKLDIPS